MHARTMGALVPESRAFSVGIFLLVLLAVCAFTGAPAFRRRPTPLQPARHGSRKSVRFLHDIDPAGHVDRCGCRLSSQPSAWLGFSPDSAKFGSQYASLVPECGLINYVGRNSPTGRPVRPLNILLFGDSVEGVLLDAWCDLQARENLTLSRWPDSR